MTSDPSFVDVLCVSLPNIIVSMSQAKTLKYMDTATKKTITTRSMIPRWPLIPNQLRSHVQLYPRIIVSNSCKNASNHVGTATLKKNQTNKQTKGERPQDATH